ncbi:MAG: hypothetical protein RLZZ631_2047 [Cyanobacteriota bacterium]|jgi:hypothetical protein
MSSPTISLEDCLAQEQTRSARVLMRLTPSDAAALDTFAAEVGVARGEAARALVRAGLRAQLAEVAA